MLIDDSIILIRLELDQWVNFLALATTLQEKSLITAADPIPMNFFWFFLASYIILSLPPWHQYLAAKKFNCVKSIQHNRE